ncbi:MAG: HD-GYP domain-containing protein, partial [Gemmatimonadota bacterium]|nr:HD-GYP domain-containing protein [Gemmatimonadota bacterium]
TENDTLRRAIARALIVRSHEVRFLGAPADQPDQWGTERAACLVLEADLGSPRVAALLAEATSRQRGMPVLLVQSGAEAGGWAPAPVGGFRGYLRAPFDARLLVDQVERALRDGSPVALGAVPREETVQHQHLSEAALDALVHAMEAKDPHLPGHSLRVAELSASVAAKLGRFDWEVEEVRLAGRLHDLGMIAVPERVLNKAGPLTPEEYDEIKQHPGLGHGIICGYPEMERVASYVRGHHERWDGTGYPDRLAGEAIPWGAQVLAAAETFDALTSPRAYRAANSVTNALERMYAQSAGILDQEVMKVVARVVGRRETLSFIRDDDAMLVERELVTPRDPGDTDGAPRTRRAGDSK